MPKTLFLLIVILAGLGMAGCATSSTADAPAAVLQAYLNALVAKQSDTLKALSCAAWESQAQMELDAFQSVTAKLDGVACKTSGTDGSTTLVQCTGKIVATYGTENQDFPLNDRTYELVQEGGEWRVCGYR